MGKTYDKDWIILDKLTEIILAHVEGCVVDIGIGPSTRVLRKHSKAFDRKHYTCDIRPTRCAWAETQGMTAFNIKSLDFIKQFPTEEKVAVFFTDAEHVADTVLKEITFFSKLMSDGGVMFMHDTYPPIEWANHGCGDVYKVRQIMERLQGFQTFTWPYTACNAGLTMVMKKEDNPPFCRE